MSGAGYTGYVEVEIFNDEIWGCDGDEVVACMVERYVDLVLPSLLSGGAGEEGCVSDGARR